MDWVAVALDSTTFYTVPLPVLLQLSTAFEAGGLRKCDSDVRYLDLASRSSVPVRLLVGDRDRQCPPAACARTYEHLSQHSDAHQMIIFGKSAGQADHYGHFDLLLGKRAVEEVFPAIEAWLMQHDAD
jgi:alpha-beta hydrolase superfamily lysophospholipase